MTADMYLPVTVHHLPAHFIFQPDGALRDKFARAVDLRVARVIAGPMACHVVIDVKRPYYRALEDV
jgi:hypothetical protein